MKMKHEISKLQADILKHSGDVIKGVQNYTQQSSPESLDDALKQAQDLMRHNKNPK